MRGSFVMKKQLCNDAKLAAQSELQKQLSYSVKLGISFVVVEELGSNNI